MLQNWHTVDVDDKITPLKDFYHTIYFLQDFGTKLIFFFFLDVISLTKQKLNSYASNPYINISNAVLIEVFITRGLSNRVSR